MTDLYDSYRSVHVELRKTLGDTYGEKYPKFDAINEKVTDYLKSVRTKIRTQCHKHQQTKGEEEIRALEVEGEFLKKKVDQYNRSIDGNVSVVRDVGTIDKYVAKMEEFIGEFFSLGTRLKCICPEKFDTDYGQDFDLIVYEMQQDIVLATKLKFEIQRFQDDFSRAESAQNAQLIQLTNA